MGVKGNKESKTSDVAQLTVSYQSKAVLSISPQWMNPGDSVTLNCKVKESSTGWRFSWYKTVPYRAGLPSLLDKSYSVETLSGYGTTEESYTLSPAGPTDTGGYVCRAGRGDPVYYTDYSEPQFLWSGDLQSSVSVRINPNRTQHFTSKSLSLTCDLKGNSTGWRLMRYTETGVESGCSPNWRSITGSTCTITSTDTGDSGVYWCESGSGQYSNAVNITVSVLPSGCSTSVLVRVVGGLVVAAVLLTILFLLCQYKKKKDSCSNRRFWPVHPQGTNQDPQQDQGSTQVQSPDAGFTGNDNIYNMMNLSGNCDNCDLCWFTSPCSGRAPAVDVTCFLTPPSSSYISPVSRLCTCSSSSLFPPVYMFPLLPLSLCVNVSTKWKSCSTLCYTCTDFSR
uniref:Ig-like domain-containing protein n=1 Tax=Esox lucius TaxID=8010 RepID=A0A6Q2WS90_ESOLU